MEDFGKQLNELRQKRTLTVRKLAERANVPNTLISGLQTNSRVIGETCARKLGMALGLQGNDLQTFIFSALNNAHVKILAEFNDYPAEIINHLPGVLKRAGIEPNKLQSCAINDNGEVTILSMDGKKLRLEVNLEEVA